MAHYLKFMFQKEVRQIFHQFSDLLGIRTTFFSPDGSQLNVGSEKPNCTYCQMLREQLDYHEICDRFDDGKREEAGQRRNLISYECPGGMIGATAPIITNGNVLCFVMIGQFRQSENLPSRIERLWQERYGNSDLHEAYVETPFYNQQKINDIMGLLAMLVKLVASQNMIHVSHSPIDPLLQYIDEHPEEMISLQEAAALVHRSVSSLSHLFKKATGKGFRQYQIERKLDKAEEYFRTHPEFSVAQISMKLGYEDPLYFSKLYKKHRGAPPIQAMQRFRQEFSGVSQS